MRARSRYLALLALSLPCAHSTFGRPLARDFFDNTVVHEVRIDLDPNDWANLKKNYQANTYYRAGVSSGSESAAGVAIRSRGRGSRTPEKPNLDVNIDKYAKKQRFAGLGFFVLKANNQDASLMHEMVAFELFRKMGLPAPREAPARLFVNGEYIGFYTIVEHEDEDFLNRNLGESGGDLFEWKPNGFYHFEDLGDDPAPYANFLDPKTNDDPDYQPFIDLVKAINNASDDDFVSSVSRYLNLDLYLTHAAVEDALAEIDGIWNSVYGTNNIFLYRFQGRDEFLMLTWDKDLTFLWPDRESRIPQDNVLARRLLAIPRYRSFYFSQLAKAADLLGGPGGWADREVSRIYSLIHIAAVDDPHKQCITSAGNLEPCGPEAFEQGMLAMVDFIVRRSDILKSALAGENYQLPSGGPEIRAVTIDAANGTARIQGANFATTAARSFVAVEGVRARILRMSPVEAVIQLPSDLPLGRVAIALAVDGQLSNSMEVSLVAP